MIKVRFAGLICAAVLLSAQTAGLPESNARPGPAHTVEVSEPFPPSELSADNQILFADFVAAVERAQDEDFRGEIVIARGSFSFNGVSNEMRQRGFGERNPGRIAIWPYASVTKQIVATLVMQEVEAGTLALDKPASTYAPELEWGSGYVPTLREIMQHRSGFMNPDEGPEDGEWSSFYSSEDNQVESCIADRADSSPESFTYNNCDYIVLGAILEASTGRSLEDLVEGLSFASGMTDVAWLNGENLDDVYKLYGEERSVIAGYGASGGLAGSLMSLVEFDRALLDGWLLGPEALAQMWEGNPDLGYMALGQWVFDAQIAGCDTPLRIVERRGHIGKYQIRNLILPDQGYILAAATEQPAFEFGEIWSGSGPLHNMVQAIACSGPDEED